MKLSIKEYEAMQSDWRKWINENIEIKGFKSWGLEIEGRDILEVGCGSGYSASLIAKENPRSYTGIDIMPEQLELAESLGLANAKFVQCDAADLSQFEDESFDVILDFMILHHVEGWRSFLDECYRVLRPGGAVFINDLTKKGVHLTDALVHWDHAEEPLFTLKEFEEQAHKSGLVTLKKINYAGLDGVFKFQKPVGVPKGGMSQPLKVSRRYKAVNALFKALGVKKMLDKQGAEFDALLEEYKEKQKKPLNIPYNNMKKFSVMARLINGTVCYVVRVRDSRPDKAVLYLFGGGYILPPDPGDILLCGQIAENCNAEVWFPLYPMAPEHRLAETLQSTLGVYKEMLKSYEAENIRFFGTSSGGGQCMSLCMYIKREDPDVPLPGRLVLQSPGLQVPPSARQKEEMERLSDLDVMIPPGFFDSIAPVLATGDEAYLLSPILSDLTGFPPIDIFYGTNEVMIAYLEDFKRACAEYGVELKVHIGEGMMHCWGAMEFVPEAKAVRQEYFKALR